MLDANTLRSVLSYDSDTGIFRWLRGRLNGRIAGAPHCKGYIQVQVLGANYLAHRLAWLHHFGEWPVEMLDHINRVRNDNRICNLRECNNALNQQNRPVVGGYTLAPHSGKFVARINAGGRRIFLGAYGSRDEAAAAYASAKLTLHPFHPQ